MYKDFFHIEPININLEDNSLYPFHLYIFNSITNDYHLYLPANSPLTKEKKIFLVDIVEKGAILSILRNQEKTFLNSQGITTQQVPGLVQDPIHDLILKREQHIEDLKLNKKSLTDSKTLLSQGIESDDFTDLILKTRDEIMSFKYTISHTVSLANYFAETLMTEDNLQNRITMLSYHITKVMGINDSQSLADIICASFIANIGHTQIDIDLSRKPELKHSSKEQSFIKKHPGLTQHLLRKSGVLISERCNQIMYGHHEKFDGSGYPEYKRGEFLDPLTIVLSASSHVVEYSAGLVSGKKYHLKEVLNCFKTKSPLPSLNIQYNSIIEDILSNIIQTIEVTEEKEEMAA